MPVYIAAVIFGLIYNGAYIYHLAVKKQFLGAIGTLIIMLTLIFSIILAYNAI